MADDMVLGGNEGPGDNDGYKPIPQDTWAEVEVTKIEDRKMPWTDKDTGAEVWKKSWTFNIVDDGPYQGRKIFADNVIDFNTNPLNRNYQWVLALLNVPELAVGFRLSTDMLIGKRARVLIGLQERKKNKGTSLETRIYVNTVEEFMPARSLGNNVVSGGFKTASKPAPQDFSDDEPFFHSPAAMKALGWKPGRRVSDIDLSSPQF